MSWRAERPRSARAAALWVALACVLAVAGCGSRQAPKAAEETAPPIPAAYRDRVAVYSLSGSSFYATAFSDGRPRRLFNAEPDLSPALFVGWLPTQKVLAFEGLTQTGRELWLYAERTGKQERVIADVDAVLGFRGDREVLYASKTDGTASVQALDVVSRKSTPVLDGEASPVRTIGGSGALFVQLDTANQGRDLYLLEPGPQPVQIASVFGGREITSAAVLPGTVAYMVTQPGSGDYGTVMLWDRASGKRSVLADEAKLLDAAEDGGVLVQKNLRSTVAGVTRSLVMYLPTGPAAASRQQQDLGAYVGALHTAAFVSNGKAVVSQRVEGTNRLEAFDLATSESLLLAEDPDLQVDRIAKLDGGSFAAVRSRPGSAAAGSAKDQPSIKSLEDELVWIPLVADAGAVTITSSSSVPMRLLGVFSAK